MTFREFTVGVAGTMFGAMVPANGGPQTNHNLVDSRRYAVPDLIDTLKSYGKALIEGAISGAGRATAEQAASSEAVRTAVKEEGQLRLGKFLTSPLGLVLAGGLVLVAVLFAVRR